MALAQQGHRGRGQQQKRFKCGANFGTSPIAIGYIVTDWLVYGALIYVKTMPNAALAAGGRYQCIELKPVAGNMLMTITTSPCYCTPIVQKSALFTGGLSIAA